MAKRKGKHPVNALSAIQVRNETRPGRYADGNGLYLVVDETGAKRWLLRMVVKGKRRDIGLGSLTVVSLAQAREAATDKRRTARAGGDPVAQARRERGVPTFAEAARKVHKQSLPAWRNAKHANQWINTLNEYAIPVIGNRRLDEIDTADVLKILAPIWLTKPVTAKRIRQRIATVIDWGKAAGFVSGENPVAGVSKGLPTQPRRDEHHAALPYAKLPQFIDRLRNSEESEVIRLALEFTVLTAARTSEVLGIQRQGEIEGSIWTVPAERIKSNRSHRVPLPKRCVEIVTQAEQLLPDEPYLFPGTSSGEPLDDGSLLKALRRLGYNVTVHGFRSSFRDWAAEQTNFPREVAEVALAHAVKDKTEAAYQRGDLFEKRRRLMEAWASFCTAERGKVARIHAA